MKTHQEFEGFKIGQRVRGRCVTMGTTFIVYVKEIRTGPGEESGARFVVECLDGNDRILKPAEPVTLEQMTDDEQNMLMDYFIREANANPVQVVMPAETAREGYYHAKPDPIA
ncbi:MAG: hypothetical protein ACTHKN_21645 [Achromobacter mucicolens]